MYKIAIVGAGQLGSRHLQGVLKINVPVEVEVVDPNTQSLELAEQRAGEIALNDNIKSVRYINAISGLSNDIDICIIATTANVRYSILSELVGSKKIKNLVLEKVLFQKLSEYTLTLDLIEKNNIKCWVNCPRRMMPVYTEIRSLISPGEKITYTVVGGEWGLACNAIHFIDHLNFLNGTTGFTYDTSGIYDVVEGRRKGNYEFWGSVLGRSNGSELFLHSRGDCGAGWKIEILTNKYLWQIDEVNGTLTTSSSVDSWKPLVSRFDFLYQSQLTNVVCENILLKGDSGLTPYAISSELHQEMLNSFIPLFNEKTGGNIDYCPIT